VPGITNNCASRADASACYGPVRGLCGWVWSTTAARCPRQPPLGGGFGANANMVTTATITSSSRPRPAGQGESATPGKDPAGAYFYFRLSRSSWLWLLGGWPVLPASKSRWTRRLGIQQAAVPGPPNAALPLTVPQCSSRPLRHLRPARGAAQGPQLSVMWRRRDVADIATELTPSHEPHPLSPAAREVEVALFGPPTLR